MVLVVPLQRLLTLWKTIAHAVTKKIILLPLLF